MGDHEDEFFDAESSYYDTLHSEEVGKEQLNGQVHRDVDRGLARSESRRLPSMYSTREAQTQENSRRIGRFYLSVFENGSFETSHVSEH